MYHSHWGLRETPFHDGTDPRFFFQSPMHVEAMARLYFVVDEHRHVGLLLGQAGTGKSLILQTFARELRRAARQVAAVNLLGAGVRELLWEVVTQWGIHPGSNDDRFSLWRMAVDRIVENRLQGLETVLLLDNADGATEEVLLQVLQLVQYDAAAGARLTVVLSARPERLRRVGRRLLDLVALRIDLAAWSEEETAAYLDDALHRAGWNQDTAVFDPEAVARLHQLAGGIPRHVAQLADLALLAGAGRELNHVDAATVDSSSAELGSARAAAPA